MMTTNHLKGGVGPTSEMSCMLNYLKKWTMSNVNVVQWQNSAHNLDTCKYILFISTVAFCKLENMVEFLMLRILILMFPLFQRKDISHIHHLPPMHWSAQYQGLGFTLPEFWSWLPSSNAWSNVAAGHQKIVQTISKLRQDAPSIYMDGIYKDNEKLPNYEIRYAHIPHTTCKPCAP
jgi:hypothetical protein